MCMGELNVMVGRVVRVGLEEYADDLETRPSFALCRMNERKTTGTALQQHLGKQRFGRPLSAKQDMCVCCLLV